VFDDLARVVETEDVGPRLVVVGGPRLVTVQRDEVALSDAAFEIDALARVLRGHLASADWLIAGAGTPERVGCRVAR
jgi:hypothetical protein